MTRSLANGRSWVRVVVGLAGTVLLLVLLGGPRAAAAAPTAQVTPVTIPNRTVPSATPPTAPSTTVRASAPPTRPRATIATTAPPAPTSTTLASIQGGTTPLSTPPLTTRQPSAHVSVVFPILSVAGFLVVTGLLVLQWFLTKPGRQGWTL